MNLISPFFDYYYKFNYYLRILAGKELFYNITTHLHKKLLGNPGAQWCIAPDHLDNNSIVYSFGVGTDVSFDIQLISDFGCQVFAFDPTPKSIEWIKTQTLSEKFNFFNYGVGDKDGVLVFYPPANSNYVSYSTITRSDNIPGVELPVLKLRTIMEKLGHNKIDLLKMDIEGAEYEVIENLLASGILAKQIQVEFHHRFDKANLSKTRKAVDSLLNNGYKIFHISPVGEEYSFIHI